METSYSDVEDSDSKLLLNAMDMDEIDDFDDDSMDSDVGKKPLQQFQNQPWSSIVTLNSSQQNAEDFIDELDIKEETVDYGEVFK